MTTLESYLWFPPAAMSTWTSAIANCTWSIGSLRPMARPSRPWKWCFQGCRHFSAICESAVQLPLQTNGLCDGRCPSGHVWWHLPLQGLPDYAAHLWMWYQGDLVKVPGMLVDRRRWKVRSSGICRHHQSAGMIAVNVWFVARIVHRTIPYQGHHQPSEQWSLCRRLAEESL